MTYQAIRPWVKQIICKLQNTIDVYLLPVSETPSVM